MFLGCKLKAPNMYLRVNLPIMKEKQYFPMEKFSSMNTNLRNSFFFLWKPAGNIVRRSEPGAQTWNPCSQDVEAGGPGVKGHPWLQYNKPGYNNQPGLPEHETGLGYSLTGGLTVMMRPWALCPALCRPGLVHNWSLSSGAKAGRVNSFRSSWLHSELEANLGYVKPCLNKTNQSTNRSQTNQPRL